MDAFWNALTHAVHTYGRPLLSKYITRLVLWGVTAISAKAAIDSPDQDTQTKVAEWLAALGAALLAGLVDYLHHRADKKGA